MAESESPAGERGVQSDRRFRVALAALAVALGASGTLISMVSQGLWDPPELETAELSRRIAHGLFGAHALGVPEDDGVPTRGELGRGELPYTLIALGFRLFGLAPWAGRAPLALLALVGVVALHVYVRRLGSSRAAWLAVLVLVTLPPYFLHARTMLGDIATMVSGLLALVGLGLATFDASSFRGRTTAFVVACVGLVMGFMCRGLLIGVAVPALGIGLAWVVARLAGARFDRSASVIGGVSLGFGALAAAVGAVALGVTSRDEYSLLVGASTGGASPVPTFDVVVRELGHALFPWSAVVVAALARLLARPASFLAESPHDERALGLRLSVVATAGVALVATTAVAPELGLQAYPAPGCLAMACGIAFDDVDRRAVASRWLGAFIGALTLVLVFDFRTLPEKGLVAFAVPDAAFPESFAGPGFLWLSSAGGLVALGCFFFLADTGPDERRFQIRDYLAWPRTLQSLWRGQLWFVLLVLIFGLLAYEAIGVLSARYLHLPLYESSGELPDLIARVGWLLALGFCIAPPLVLLGRDSVRALIARIGPGSRGSAACLVVALAAGAMSLGYYPALMRQLSPKQAFDAYLGRAQPGEPLGLLGPDAKALRYQAGASARKLGDVGEALDYLLAPGTERRFLALRGADLAALNAGYRARSQPRRNLHIVEASSSELLLALSRPGSEANRNPLAAFLPASRPKPAHALDVDLGGKLQVLGWDVRNARGDAVDIIQTGMPYTFSIYYEVRERLSGIWDTFIHVDGLQRRYNGDHPSLGGRYPPSFWLPGDFVVDRHEIQLLPNFAPGVYRVYFGMYAGERRLEVRRGEHEENRISAGILTIE